MPESTLRLIDPDHLPEGDDKATAVQSMFDSIAPRYDLANRLLTFRMDVGWRKRAIRELNLKPGSLVADIAAGTGDLCYELHRSGIRAIGIDLSYGMLASAPKRFEAVQGDALSMPLPASSIDGVTCGFALRNFVSLDPFFLEMGRVVKPGGRIALLEVSEPENPLLRMGHGFYFGRIVPLVGGLISDRDAYRYLPKSVSYLPEPATMLDNLAAAGFEDIERTLLSGGISQLITATRSSTSSTSTRG